MASSKPAYNYDNLARSYDNLAREPEVQPRLRVQPMSQAQPRLDAQARRQHTQPRSQAQLRLDARAAQHTHQQQHDAQRTYAQARPTLRTIEGQGRARAAEPRLLPWLKTSLALGAVLVMVLATVFVARVTIANATVQQMYAAEQTREAITAARAVGMELEVKYSLANNPTRIQDAAALHNILPAGQLQTLIAHEGLTPETLDTLGLAANQARAAEAAALEAGGFNGAGEAAATLEASGINAALPFDAANEAGGFNGASE